MAKFVIAPIVFIATSWLKERYILADAIACNARGIDYERMRLIYYFADVDGNFYGDSVVQVQYSRPAETSQVVIYRRTNPAYSLPAPALLFHRLEVLGRGLTDLDEETTRAHAHRLQPGDV